MKTEETEKKGEKVDVSISNHETGFLSFLRFIAFTTFVTVKNFVKHFVETLSINSLPHQKKIQQLVTFMGINR